MCEFQHEQHLLIAATEHLSAERNESVMSFFPWFWWLSVVCQYYTAVSPTFKSNWSNALFSIRVVFDFVLQAFCGNTHSTLYGSFKLLYSKHSSTFASTCGQDIWLLFQFRGNDKKTWNVPNNTRVTWKIAMHHKLLELVFFFLVYVLVMLVRCTNVHLTFREN